MEGIWIWTIALLGIAGVLSQPFDSPEWIWAAAAAGALTATGLLPMHAALQALQKGTDVYLFLLGMMMLSELARDQGVFDWIAQETVALAKSSARRLLLLIYGAGVIVTVFLSNDATAVVLTPAVYAAIKKSGAQPRPYLFACALVANAASFVLPISNPANLVVYQSHLPSVFEWLRLFALPSLVSISITYFVLRLWFRKDLKTKLGGGSDDAKKLKRGGIFTFAGLGVVVVTLLVVSALEKDLGLPTFIAATAVLATVSISERKFPKRVLKDISWSVIPLVGGLFIIVEAMNHAGALKVVKDFFSSSSDLPAAAGSLAAAFGVSLASNVLNNLPVGLTSGQALHETLVSDAVKQAVLIGVDLGPNLSVTGSLATILWLMAIRREGEHVSGVSFFLLGCVAMPVAVAASVLCSTWLAHA